MNKSDLVEVLAENLTEELDRKVSKAEASSIYSVMFETIVDEAMEPGSEVPLGKIGVLKNMEVHRAARKGRNPQTGEELKIKAKDTVSIKIAFSKGVTGLVKRAQAAYAKAAEAAKKKAKAKKSKKRKSKKSDKKRRSPKTKR